MRFFFLLFLLVAACRAAAPVLPPVSATTAPPTAISYLALGDSYTIGEGAAAADRWPVQLAALARQHGTPLSAPDIIARTGWTTAELQHAIAASGNHRTDYGLVSLLIGVNNQYRGQSLATYRAELRQLLATAVAFAGGNKNRVLVLSIPDWGQTPFAEGRDQAKIGQEIDQFNVVAHEECQHADVAFVNITPLTRAAASQENQFTADGLHYTGAQMRHWAEQAWPVLQKLMQ
jgi:lysophospholipase L1-like esterase